MSALKVAHLCPVPAQVSREQYPLASSVVRIAHVTPDAAAWPRQRLRDQVDGAPHGRMRRVEQTKRGCGPHQAGVHLLGPEMLAKPSIDRPALQYEIAHLDGLPGMLRRFQQCGCRVKTAANRGKRADVDLVAMLFPTVETRRLPELAQVPRRDVNCVGHPRQQAGVGRLERVK